MCPGRSHEKAPWASVIVVNYNAGAHLVRCLAALRAQNLPDFEAIVLDNGSTDGSFARARAGLADPRFRFEALGRNLGFAAANNRGAELARAPWLALLNPDAFAEPGWLAALKGAAERNPDIDLFGSLQLSAADPARLDGAGDHYFAGGFAWRGGFGHPARAAPPQREIFGPCAAAALVRAARFRALGGFDARYFCYVEDVDLAFRHRLAGGRALHVPGAVVRHVGGAIAGRSAGFARYHGTRNSLWTFVKNMPGPLFWFLGPVHVALHLLRLAAASARGDAADVARGLRDGIAGLPAIWRERRRVQRGRRASWLAIARALKWSPLAFARKAP